MSKHSADRRPPLHSVPHVLPPLSEREAADVWLARFRRLSADLAERLQRCNATFSTRPAYAEPQQEHVTEHDAEHVTELLAAGLCRHSCGRPAVLRSGECFTCAATSTGILS
jgi:hypothetical protein